MEAEYFSGSIAVFILLRILLCVSLFFAGRKISFAQSKDSIIFKEESMICILLYALIEGLRYGRGIDFDHYRKLYENAFKLRNYWDEETIEPFFQIVNKTINYLGFPYYLMFSIYSSFLIISCFSFIRNHKKVAVYILPFFFFSTIGQSENLIRQFFAFSIILYSFNYLFNDDWIKFSLLMTLAFFTHNSSLVVLPFVIIFKFIKNPFGNLYVILSLYCISWLINSNFWSSNYEYFNLLEKIGYYERYATNSEVWFSGEQQHSLNSSNWFYIRIFLFNVGIISVGYLIKERFSNYNFSFFYGLFVIGAIFQMPTANIELLNRLNLYFYVFWFVVLSYILYFAFNSKESNLQIRIIGSFLLLNCVYDYLISPLIYASEKTSLFVWDVIM